jgi:hypothetical protein
MIKDNKIYLYYEGYESRFGQARRPAVVRYSKRVPFNNRYGDNDTTILCTVFIDGKSDTTEFYRNGPISSDACSLVMIAPFWSDDNVLKDYNLEARKFNANSIDDWCCLFHDTSEFQRMGDKMAYANLAIALGKFQINTDVVINALYSINEEVRSRIIGFINYVAYGLSVSKIQQITEIIGAVGSPVQLFFPSPLEEAAQQYDLEYNDLCVHKLVDKLFEVAKKSELDNPTGFNRFIQWLNNDSISISVQELDAFFPYLSEEKRSTAIKRYFYDVKRNVLSYDSETLKVFSSQNYQYYSSLRYVFEKWPGNRNVSTEFLLDCLDTYRETNQQQFQVSDGILDWAIQKAIELNRPVEMKFYDWLCYCQGGVVINKEFQGFAEFYIQYELDDLMFEDDSLLENINRILRGHCDRRHHSIKKLGFDSQTGEYSHFSDSKKPRYHYENVWDNLWRGRSDDDLSFIKQFVDLSKCDLIISSNMLNGSAYEIEGHKTEEIINKVLSHYCEQITHNVEIVEIDEKLGSIKRDPITGAPIIRTIRTSEDGWRLKNNDDIYELSLLDDVEEYQYTYFTPELLKEALTYESIEQYLVDHYETKTPFISDRFNVEIVRLFACPIRMKAVINESSHIGIPPGVDEAVVKERVKNRLIELFGETLECDYEQALYERAQTDSQYGRSEKSPECFVKKIKHYYREREIYCAPELADEPNLLTGRKCAYCQGDMCFLTSIKKEPEWKELSLIHILEIIGYNVLEETEAGFIPNQVYNQFVNQINKAIRFYKRLTCRECGHILFPAQPKGHTRFKCLLPACSEYNKEVYLNYCYDCKKGIIDSRETKQCPNGLYICPTCNSCCSNKFFESMALKYQRQGRHIPAFISRNAGKGHKELNMVFCPQCGTQKTDYVDRAGNHELRCLTCHPIEEDQAPSFDENGSIQTSGGNEEYLDPWA